MFGSWLWLANNSSLYKKLLLGVVLLVLVVGVFNVYSKGSLFAIYLPQGTVYTIGDSVPVTFSLSNDEWTQLGSPRLRDIAGSCLFPNGVRVNSYIMRVGNENTPAPSDTSLITGVNYNKDGTANTAAGNPPANSLFTGGSVLTSLRTSCSTGSSYTNFGFTFKARDAGRYVILYSVLDPSTLNPIVHIPLQSFLVAPVGGTTAPAPSQTPPVTVTIPTVAPTVQPTATPSGSTPAPTATPDCKLGDIKTNCVEGYLVTQECPDGFFTTSSYVESAQCVGASPEPSVTPGASATPKPPGTQTTYVVKAEVAQLNVTNYMASFALVCHVDGRRGFEQLFDKTGLTGARLSIHLPNVLNEDFTVNPGDKKIVALDKALVPGDYSGTLSCDYNGVGDSLQFSFKVDDKGNGGQQDNTWLYLVGIGVVLIAGAYFYSQKKR